MIGYILRRFPVLSETFILNEILELEKQGHTIHIFSLHKPHDPRFHPKLAKLNAQITYVPEKWKTLLTHRKRAAKTFKKGYRKALWYVLSHFKPTLFLRFLQSCYLANKARELRITHLHSHFANRPTTLSFLTSMIMDLPYTFTAHAVDIFKTSLCSRALQKKMERAKCVVTVSDYNKNHLAGIAPTANILKVCNGIDLTQFKGDTKNSAPFTFICVARFVEKKGHMTLLEACRLLDANFQLWLIGFGPLMKKIEKKIVEMELKDKVILIGPQSQKEVVERYHKAHAYILPCCVGSDGNRDGLPVSIVESLACGLPVITTPMTGNPEVVKDGVNGLLIPFNNPKATAEAMKRLMTDQTLYQRLQSQARESIEETFDVNKTIPKLSQLFQECSP